MVEKLPLTAEEAAKILKISKYTLYELVKRGEIKAQHVGRQLRFDPETLTAFCRGEKPSLKPMPVSASLNTDSAGVIFAGSHDPAVEMLIQFGQHLTPGLTISAAFTGSMEGLIALYRHQASMIGIHLWDSVSGEYNLPFIRYCLPGEEVTVVNLVQRVQGWIAAPGNPLGVSGWSDITRPGLRLVNRQKGSGTRIRLDTYLHQAGIQAKNIRGYELEENTHFGAACRVANNEADVGIGVQAMAARLGLDFVPLFEERYDLVCLQEFSQKSEWRQVLDILNSLGFLRALKSQPGYNTSLTGKIIFQSGIPSESKVTLQQENLIREESN
jgi:putative molybdopterin biosynthesis protein